jgi:hypothetical protein
VGNSTPHGWKNARSPKAIQSGVICKNRKGLKKCADGTWFPSRKLFENKNKKRLEVWAVIYGGTNVSPVSQLFLFVKKIKSYPQGGF